MINALRYEPRGHRQRFEPREQQRGEQQEQDWHLHLHFHLNLTFRAQKAHSIHPNAMRITRIFSDLLAATVMPFGIFIFNLLILSGPIHDGPPDPLLSLWNLAFLILCSGLALAWGFGCLPLLVSAFRASPSGRLSLLGPLVLRLFIGIACLFLLGTRFPLVTMLAFLPFVLLLVAHPLITALFFMRVSREARALREMTPAHTRLSFVLMSGMGITLLGGLLLNLSLCVELGSWQFAPFLPAMGATVIVAIYTLFQSRESTQARPKDASPSDADSLRERGYHPVDRNQKEKLQGEAE
jgi:hypothetical protein